MATVRVSGPLLQLSVMWSTHTHTHTHTHPIISISGRGDVSVAADVSGAMLPPLRPTGHHHLLLRTVIPTGC